MPLPICLITFSIGILQEFASQSQCFPGDDDRGGPEVDVNKIFIEFRRTHNREYKSLAELKQRRAIFFDNYHFAVAENKKTHGTNLGSSPGMGPFSDRAEDEMYHKVYMKQYLEAKRMKFEDEDDLDEMGIQRLGVEELRKKLGYWYPVPGSPEEELEQARTSKDVVLGSPADQGTQMDHNPRLGAFRGVDWVKSGAVTEVRDQGNCGACWAFATTAVLETQLYLRSGTLVQLSPQHLIDCVQDNDHCNGGKTTFAALWIQQNGMVLDRLDPYLCMDPTMKECRLSICNFKVPKIIHPNSLVGKNLMLLTKEYDSLMLAIQKGTVSVLLTSSAYMYLYPGGIMSECTNQESLHAMVVVGYGHDSGIPYWKLKNSWGKHWGEEGYLRLRRHRSISTCGIYNFMLAIHLKSDLRWDMTYAKTKGTVV